ncbi:MAG: gas vesicle protein GvpD P-loop domain-containing protein [Thermoplasmata archaeon]
MKEKGIPDALLDFFRGPGGHSLIVKGTAGTGKTTFALQLTEELESVENSYYMSIRVSDQSLYNQFPWLKDRMEFSKRIAPTRTEHVSEEEEGKVHRTELKKLEGRIEMGEEDENSIYDKISEGEVTETGLILDLGSDLPEIDKAYDVVENALPEKTLILIDSINALAERYGIHPSKLMNTLQRDLVETSSSDVLYVLESSGETRLDYLGDGVISFTSEEHAGRRLRIMKIEKLRGTEIRQHKCAYSLDGGRIRTFGFEKMEIPDKKAPWVPVPDISENWISTGNEQLDSLIGGFKKGTIVALEIGGNVDTVYSDLLKTSLISNFVSLGRGVAFVPEKKASSEIVRDEILPFVGEEALEKCMRVFEPSATTSVEGSRIALPMEGADVDNELKWSNIEYHLSRAERPILSLMGFDTLEAVFGHEVIEEMAGHMSSIRKSKDIFLGIVTSTTSSTSPLANLAHTHIKIENIDGSVILYGEKPYTELHALSFDHSKGHPKAVLTPII